MNYSTNLLGYKCQVEWGSNSFPLLKIFLKEDKRKIHYDIIDKILSYLSKEGFLNEETGKRVYPQVCYCIHNAEGDPIGSKGIIQLKADGCWESEFSTWDNS